MSFKKMPSVKKSYNEQGYIYFTTHTYYSQPNDVKAKIDNICGKVGKYHYKALFRAITTDEPLERIARENYISARNLRRLRTAFYDAWK